jgi:hypothetical protein
MSGHNPSEGEEVEAISEDEKAQRAALERIAHSRPFATASARVELLRFLFENRHKRTTETEIAIEHLGLERGKEINSGKARKLCGSVRQALKDYAEVDVSHDAWRFFLEPANRDGYQLGVVNLHLAMGATHRFWRAHLDPVRPVFVVHDEPLFFRDEINGTVIRIPQYETGCGERALQQASIEIKRMFREEVTAPLHPCHLYTLSGSIGARDRIAEWFANEYGLKTENKISRLLRDVSDIADCSPVLLGNIRTNKIIQEITALHQFGHFGYFMEAKEFRTVEIRGFTEKEKAAFPAHYNATVSGEDLVLHDDPRPDSVVFCVVTRMPNPYDSKSSITILSSGYTKVLEPVAETLTSDTLLSEALANTDIPMDVPFPRYFQGLFSIRLGPTGPDDKPARPALRCCRFFDRFNEQSE